ncbi:MAG: hypothetical protein K9N23_20980 [Akkermansiaceae bacterium]|nr:hypothetical protein [Akkermansiaceae bacterium]
MRHFITLTALLALSVAATATAAPVDRLRQSFDQRCEQAATERDTQLDKLNASYRGALERLLEKTKASGKLDAALPVHQEIEAVKQGGAKLPEIPTDAPGELSQLRTKYQDGRYQILKTHAATLVGLADTMDAALKAREAELTKAGKLKDAVFARDTRESLAKDRDFLAARDLLKLGGSSGKGKPAMQLRRYGDNLEVLVYYDRMGKVSMDSPVENIREKTGEGKELGDTKALTLGEFVGAKGYTVDPYVAYHKVFDKGDTGGLLLSEIVPEFRYEVEKSKGMKLSLKPKPLNPYGSFGPLLPTHVAKGTFRISTRYFVPKANRALAGFRFVQHVGGAIGGMKFQEKGRWVTDEVIAESAHDAPTLRFYLNIADGRKAHDAVGEYVVLGDLKVEHLKFTAYVQQRAGESGKPENVQNDPLLQPVLITNGEFVEK